jgi:hypothetical protein
MTTFKNIDSWAWWCMPVIPAVWRRLREEDPECKASLGYITRHYFFFLNDYRAEVWFKW